MNTGEFQQTIQEVERSMGSEARRGVLTYAMGRVESLHVGIMQDPLTRAARVVIANVLDDSHGFAVYDATIEFWGPNKHRTIVVDMQDEAIASSLSADDERALFMLRATNAQSHDALLPVSEPHTTSYVTKVPDLLSGETVSDAFWVDHKVEPKLFAGQPLQQLASIVYGVDYRGI